MTTASKKYLLFTIVGLVILGIVGAGLAVGVYLTRQNQDVRQQASSGTGTATVDISPTTSQLNANQSTTFTVSFNPHGIPISGISVRLQYTFSGTQPLLTAAQPTPIIIEANPNWNCPVATTAVNSGKVTIDVGCLYLTTTGFTSESNTPLFSFTATAGTTATSNPITISFDPTDTIITKKSDGTDVAATPMSTANVTILTPALPTPSPNPTATPTPSPLPTTSLTQSPTQSPTPRLSITPGASYTPTPSVSPHPSATATPRPTSTPSATGTPTPTTAASLGSCNSSCLANRECATGLLCVNSRCRNSRCSSDTTCGCADLNVASQSGTTSLPDSGSTSLTIFTFLLGSLFLLSGGSLLLSRVRRDIS